MSRLIDAEDIEPHEIYEDYGFVMVAYMDDIDAMPTVDAAPVVYCKNCIYRGNPMKCPLATYTIKQNPNHTEQTTTNPYAEYKSRTVVEMQDNTNDYDYCSKGVMRK